jgi:hypothetical protein
VQIPFFSFAVIKLSFPELILDVAEKGVKGFRPFCHSLFLFPPGGFYAVTLYYAEKRQEKNQAAVIKVIYL